MSRVAIYIRVSTEEQVHGFSIDMQKERLAAYCTSQGWEAPDMYIDDGYTGTNTDRPALKRLIRNIENGKIDSVVVYKLDRLGRKQKDVLHLLEDVFEKNNVSFKSATEPFDTSTPLGKAMLGILAVFAQLERDMIIERTTSGRRQRTRQGKWYGGRAAFGYEWDKELQMLKVKADEARLVREIFQRYINGASLLAIAEWASKRTKARKFDHSIIREMLLRYLYTGKLINSGEVVDGIHEAIIDDKTWEAAQIEMERRRDGIAPTGEYLLTGLLECGVCGGSIVHVKRTTHKSNKSYTYELYACKKQHVREKDRSGSCTLGYQKREEVEEYVIAQIKELSVNTKRIKEIIQNSKHHDNDIEIENKLQRDMETVNASIENLYDAIQSGVVKASSISDRLKRLEEAREALQLQLDELEVTPSYRDAGEMREILGHISQAWPYMELEEQKQVIRKAITRVVLKTKDNPEITWNVVDL